jgi:hypothetical protein
MAPLGGSCGAPRLARQRAGAAQRGLRRSRLRPRRRTGADRGLHRRVQASPAIYRGSAEASMGRPKADRANPGAASMHRGDDRGSPEAPRDHPEAAPGFRAAAAGSVEADAGHVGSRIARHSDAVANRHDAPILVVGLPGRPHGIRAHTQIRAHVVDVVATPFPAEPAKIWAASVWCGRRAPAAGVARAQRAEDELVYRITHRQPREIQLEVRHHAEFVRPTVGLRANRFDLGVYRGIA